jgi:hypothetical protein
VLRLGRAGIVVAATVALLAGCGGSGDDARRDAVNAYIDQANRAQEPAIAENAAIDEALAAFTLQRMTTAKLRRLEQARAKLRESIRRVQALEPPPEAVKLHRSILRLLRLQAALVHELVWTARYVRENDGAAEPLDAAGKTLTRDLGRANSARELANAFGRYEASLEQVLAELDAIDAPPLLRAALDAERRAIRRGANVSGQIVDALERGDVDEANARIADLLALAGNLDSIRTQKEQIAAAKAYNERVARIDRAGAQVARERQALVLEVA